MAGSTAPVTGTGPTTKAINSLKALRDRIENMELAIKRLQANRNPQTFAMAQLTNAQPMSKVADGQVPVYSKASGQYEPGSVYELGPRDGGYVLLTSSGTIILSGGGCGPNLIQGSSWEMISQMTFTSQFIFMTGLRTSAGSSGQLYNSGGTLKIS